MATSPLAPIKSRLAPLLPKRALDLYYALRKLDAEALKQNLGYRLRRGDGLPLPGIVRLTAVAGTPNVEWFLHSGAAAYDGIASAVERHTGEPVAALDRVLDFGCGCGRVIRHWRAVGVELVGCDYDASSIRWCRRHLDFATFSVTGSRPPTPFPDASFGLIYALSVLTHVAAELQQSWLDELHRILRPGGLLYFTTHGESYLDQLTPTARTVFRAGEPVVENRRVAGTNLCGVYHPPAYVETLLRPRYELLEHLPEDAPGNPHQDVWLARRPAA